jgi:hypothetical protein
MNPVVRDRGLWPNYWISLNVAHRKARCTQVDRLACTWHCLKEKRLQRRQTAKANLHVEMLRLGVSQCIDARPSSGVFALYRTLEPLSRCILAIPHGPERARSCGHLMNDSAHISAAVFYTVHFSPESWFFRSRIPFYLICISRYAYRVQVHQMSETGQKYTTRLLLPPEQPIIRHRR